ncbi:hypothetical protein [Novosphingobium sp. BL-52-GroH]|uniref:hypothetical protein n=1 Tax=Novosphingobium sp. BL-52-GroH TaxID=3349877 RepID=UPI0038511143
MSWLFEWIFEGILQEAGETIHRRYGWGGCLSVLLVLALLFVTIVWLAGIFPSQQ